jgi:hypothetical protein
LSRRKDKRVTGAPGAASQIRRITQRIGWPPEASIFFNFPEARNATYRLSSDQKGAVAPSVPGNSRAVSPLSLHTQSAVRLAASVSARTICRPSGEMTNSIGDGAAVHPRRRVDFLPWPPLTWMPDGRLIFAAVRNGGGSDLLTVSAGGGEAEDLLVTEFSEDAARVSPDGRWLAYRSNRSGRSEIWVRAIAGSAPIRVSQDGGREPIWSRDGRELFYLQGNKVIALTVKAGQEFSFAPPRVLFDRPYSPGFGDNPTGLDITAQSGAGLDLDAPIASPPAGRPQNVTRKPNCS